MATQGKAGKQSKSADAGQDFPVEAPAESILADAPAYDAPFAETVASPTVLDEPVREPAVEIVDVVAAPLAVIEEAVESATEAFAASIEFDAGAWSKKSFELWAESAAAFLELAEQVAKAQSFEEVVDLQSRFANARFEAFVRQSQDLMGFAKSLATFSATPLYDFRKAA